MGVKISKILSDPTVPKSVTETEVPESDFSSSTPTTLTGPHVKIQANATMSARRFNPDTLQSDWYSAIKLPWKDAEPQADGSFVYPVSATADLIPYFSRDEVNGKAALDPNGMQTWTMPDDQLPLASAFVTLNDVYRAATVFGGRELPWGVNGQLVVNSDAMNTFNAFYSPATRKLSFGDYLFTEGDATKVGRLISSSDVIRHEAGHAMHAVLKPNQCDWLSPEPLGFGQWGESFGDQNYMWSALQDPQFVDQLVGSFGGGPLKLDQSNILSKIGEFGTPFIGGAIRDAFNSYTVSQVSDEVHDRSQVLTGAMYRVFESVYQSQVNKLMHSNGRSGGSAQATPEETKKALAEAGKILGTLAYRTSDHVPENFNTLREVALGYLTTDEVHFAGSWGQEMQKEFIKRELLTPNDITVWKASRKAISDLNYTLRGPKAEADAAAFLKTNQTALLKSATQFGFGLKLQNTYTDDEGRLFIRASLTHTQTGVLHLIGNQALYAFSKPKPDGTRDFIDIQEALPVGLSPGAAKKILIAAYAQNVAQTPVLTPVGGSAKFDVAWGEVTSSGADDHPVGQVRYSRTLSVKPQGDTVDLSGSEGKHFGRGSVVEP